MCAVKTPGVALSVSSRPVTAGSLAKVIVWSVEKATIAAVPGPSAPAAAGSISAASVAAWLKLSTIGPTTSWTIGAIVMPFS